MIKKIMFDIETVNDFSSIFKKQELGDIIYFQETERKDVLRKKQKITEKGPWRLFNYSKPGEVEIISDDFTHDAVLRIDGDFYDLEEKKAYALEIAKRLNAYKE